MNSTLPQTLHPVKRLLLLQLEVDKAILHWNQEVRGAEFELRSAIDRHSKATRDLWCVLMQKDLVSTD